MIMKTKSFISAIATTLALAFSNTGIAQTLPVPDNCRIVNGICYKFDNEAKTALVSTYKTRDAERGRPWEEYYDYNGHNMIIPSTVTIYGEEYTVTGFDNPIRNFMWTAVIDTIDVPSTIAEICPNLCNYADVKTVILHEGLKTIGDNAFPRQARLSEIVLPESLDSIGNEAFIACHLKTIIIPSNTKKLGFGIFKGCSALEEATLPDGIREIPLDMFARTAITSIALPSTVEAIGPSAFSETKLQSIEMPTSLREIGEYAFSGCPLSSIKFNDGLEIIAPSAFLRIQGEPMNLILPYELKEIGDMAFLYSSIKEVTIQKNVNKIGEDAFKGCPLEKVVSLIEQPRYTPLPFQAFDDNIFLYQPLYVPTGLVDEYRRVIYWNKFYDIFEMDMSPLDRVETDAKSRHTYTIDGRTTNAIEQGINVIEENGMSRIILKK